MTTSDRPSPHRTARALDPACRVRRASPSNRGATRSERPNRAPPAGSAACPPAWKAACRRAPASAKRGFQEQPDATLSLIDDEETNAGVSSRRVPPRLKAAMYDPTLCRVTVRCGVRARCRSTCLRIRRAALPPGEGSCGCRASSLDMPDTDMRAGRAGGTRPSQQPHTLVPRGGQRSWTRFV